jgi:ADP-ribose pyrophosphatase YjhB (NUDIX family)
MSKDKPRLRTDYWDDPHAPKPTSRTPSASVVLRNHRGELLLLRRAVSGRWTIPTGALKKNETLTACAIRERREETGLEVKLTGLAGIFSDPRHRIANDDGEVRVPVRGR